MAKRKRPNKLIDNMSAQSVEETPVAEKAAESIRESSDSILEPNIVTAEVAQTLEQAEELKVANAQLFQEKSDLTDQLSTYIAQNNALKNEVEQLKEKVKALESELSSEKAAKAEIQSQSDDYLMKISDISYELAQLKTKTTTAVPQLVSTCEAAIVPDTASRQNTTPSPCKEVNYNKPKRYRRILPRNGYSSWN